MDYDQVIEAVNSCEGRISCGADSDQAFTWLREELAQIAAGVAVYDTSEFD
jgi:phage terminase Nu1 subunit (DNA packaging protein)